MIKACTKCGIEKSFSEYYKKGKYYNGECKVCVIKRVHKYWESGRGKEVDKKRQQKPARKEWLRVYTPIMYKKHKNQRTARVKFWNKFRHGTIKKLPCQICSTEELVEAHHPDYDKPYDVMWLCSYHHKEWHRNNESLNKS